MALNAATDQQYHLLDQDGTADDQMDQLQGDHDTVSRDAIGAQSHAEEDASWQAAKSTKKRKQEALERRRGSAGPQDQVKTGTSTFKKLPKLPPLPKDDYKIVIRPNQGLPLRNILTPTLAQAIIEACQAGIRDDQFILRINPGSNIAILSTKYEEVADKVRLIRTLVLNGRAHAVRAYAANGDDTLRGVVHGVPMNTSTETLMAHLRVRMHGVEIITARMIGTTKSAAITFFGPTLPRAVYYYGGKLRCYPFRPTIQVCKVCREKGHRADVCPHPDRPICRLCGLTNPTDGHPCSISCASCGEAHLTGDPTCKRRLKPPKPKRPQVQAGHSDKLQQGTSNDPPRTKNLRWFSSEEEENAYKSADDKHSSRSPSRSPGRKPHSPSKKSAPASTQQNLHHSPPGRGAKSNGGDQGRTQQASSLLGYSADRPKGTRLLEAIQRYDYTLLTTPGIPTRIGNSVNRDTTPDLTITNNAATMRWSVLDDNLGSDHNIPLAAAPTLGTPASELHPAMALNAATDQQYHLLDQDGTADDQMDQLQGDHDTVSRDAIGAQSHAEEDASWQAAKSTKKRKQEALERRRGSAGPQDQVKTGTSTFKKLPKLPPLPKDDYKIVIRPNQGLPLRNILTPTLAQAIIEACQAGIRDDQFILRINPGSNIAILSTKYEEVADKVRLIRTLVLNGRAHAVRAYAANGDDTLRGVVHGVPMNTSTETLMAHLRVRMHGVEIITARMIGTTKSAAITFFGPTLPRAVYYYGGKLRCYPFRPTIQVCKVCREKGHRADVCPHPDRPICRLCGLTNPTDGHPCSISCASCGEAHLTGDPTCKRRLKPPKPKRPQVQAGHSDKLQQGTSNDPPRTKNLRWFSSEEEENAYKSADDKHSSRSPSRSPGRKPHSPSKKSAPASTQQNLHHSPPGRGAKSNGGDQGRTQQASSLLEATMAQQLGDHLGRVLR
ncbi:hypothetical protein HPB52_005511 [Rhipicephalus sanguineus]|uniref:CCHC-type domain-containing protein n=1 Tax=Rhipicephalus sanguineus TaxID=34632 RepID=A0A9D4PNT2_RHISA|nr:hypothetical protein HPB52_005511 [Rhipicephalus sanguineus]